MSASVRLPVDLVTEQPWALLRSTLQQIVDVATSEASAPVAATRMTQASRQGVISVVPIRGVIEHRASLLGELLGGTSIETIRASLDEAAADPDVAAIVLDVDSPGGGVVGVTELAADIRKARESKPIVAVANGTAASAAYWLAAQADRIYATPSGKVGSIGIYAVHMDVSAALEAEGVKPTIISAGEHKTEGNEMEPLTDEARSDMQAQVDAYYASFIKDVARGRRTTAATVEADYGQGRTLLASDALEAGLVDAVGTLGDAVRQAAKDARSADMRAEREDAGERMPFSTRVHHTAADLAALVAHARTRADLRAREHRPSFSADIEDALRSIRDDALALSGLLDDPATPDEPAPATPPADEPPAEAPPPPPRRFKDRAAWLRHLEVDTAS